MFKHFDKSNSGMDVAVDSTVDVNQGGGGGGGGGGDGGSSSNNGAVIGLSVTLGVLLLGLLVAAVAYKRNVIMDWVGEKRQARRKDPMKESSSERSSVDYKARRNNQVVGRRLSHCETERKYLSGFVQPAVSDDPHQQGTAGGGQNLPVHSLNR